MKRSTRGLLYLAAILPAALLLLAFSYQLGMHYLEGQNRDFWTSLEWAAETLTTIGYSDSHWHSPVMVLFVVIAQFMGVFLVFMVFPLYVLPFIEERFEARLPVTLPRIDGRRWVFIYRYGPAVAMLIDDLRRFGRRVVILEEDAATARRLLGLGLNVVHASLGDEHLDLSPLLGAEAIVANGEDHDNAAMIFIAREAGFQGRIYAMVDEPLHRDLIAKAGADAVYTPRHVLAAALAAKAGRRLLSRVSGLQQLGSQVTVTEMRIHPDSPLAGRALAEVQLRERFGVNIIGQWVDGEFQPGISGRERLAPGAIIVAIGSPRGIARLGEIATPLKQGGAIVVLGYGEVGRKIVELLRDTGERTTVIDVQARPGVDVVGNALEQATLERAGVREAGAVVLALSNDNEALFAASVIRGYAPQVPLIARVNQAQTVKRLYRVGTDFALSISQVAGPLLARQMLGETYVSLEPTVKVVGIDASSLAGRHPLQTGIRERCGALVVALERDGKLIVEFDEEERLAPGDALFLCGAPEALEDCFDAFPALRPRSPEPANVPGAAQSN